MSSRDANDRQKEASKSLSQELSNTLSSNSQKSLSQILDSHFFFDLQGEQLTLI